ncbi:hypothetical protein DPMN_087992 [Dreissena polymorpha]|uniref:Uncharacterized protein n=1 Tax=Dreissena polymorpha TaxID=45954 RepID=A0A9D4KU22_DREPO|nr:hypothetical protein DPMN_087992 [Dreissena polymorpha]
MKLYGKLNYLEEMRVLLAFIEQVRKKKPCHTDHVDGAVSEDELNTTTLFTVNENARFARDDSLQYTYFRALPLTPNTLRKTSMASSPDDDTLLLMIAFRRQLRVPPSDLSNLRGSHESVSFAPYTARMRSTETVVTTERLLPPLKEEKSSTCSQKYSKIKSWQVTLQRTVRKKKPCHTDHVDGAVSEDELNTTTLFIVNENARFARDGSLQYTYFRVLPFSTTSLRKTSNART